MNKAILCLLLLIFGLHTSHAQVYQSSCNPDTFTVDTVGWDINWQQFPDFNLAHTVIYHGVAPADSMLYPLQKGFSHIAERGQHYRDTIPYNQRVHLWTGIANADNWALNTNQPWRMIKSPWNNDIAGYRKSWMGRTGHIAKRRFKTIVPDSLPTWDMIILDLEWHLGESGILAIKTDSLVPPYYRGLDDSTFISEYKKAMVKLYTEPIKLLKDSFNTDIKITSYADIPINRTWWGIDDTTWSAWTTDSAKVNYIMLDTAQNTYGEFYDSLDFLSPSIYNFYNRDTFSNGKKYLGYNLFQMEVNKAWSPKDQLVFVWLNYHGCCSKREAIQPDMAEVSAIFPLMLGESIYNWKHITAESNAYEYFIKGLYRMSAFNHFFDGTEIYVTPVPAHQSFINNEPIWRGVVNQNSILVAAHNPFANPTDTTVILVSYGSWADSVAVLGREVFLCEFDMGPASAIDANNEAVQLSLYPNPTSNILFIQTSASIQRAWIVDMSGKVLNAEVKDASINIEQLPKGVYLLQLETKKGVVSQKFVKQ